MVLPGLTTARDLRRPTPPGVHGANRRVKTTDYKVRLMEKQKLRWHYGILEKQFIRYIKEASRRRGPTGRNLVNLLECRLDSVVWRLGLAPTIPAARQLVVHGHITVDGRRVDRPSAQVAVGQIVSVRERVRQKPFIQEAIAQGLTRSSPEFLEFDPAKVTGHLTREPEAEDLPLEVNLQAIIEFYSQKL